MALLMKQVGTEEESIVVTKVSTGQNYNLQRGEKNMVNLEVDDEGIIIQFKDNRVMKITASNSKLTFADTSTKAQIVFSIKGGNVLGDSTFDVVRSAGPQQQFTITNTELRFCNEYLDPGQIPRKVYHILTKTSHGEESEDTWKLTT